MFGFWAIFFFVFVFFWAVWKFWREAPGLMRRASVECKDSSGTVAHPPNHMIRMGYIGVEINDGTDAAGFSRV